ncbi:MAG: VOC family protein [Candidatus Hermodarchaeota archaeon]
MSKKPLEIDFSDLKVAQLGFIVKNAEERAKIMELVYGMPEFAIMEDKGTVLSRGKERNITLKIAMSRFNNMQIELIEVVEGECIFTEFLDSGREGLQHLSYFIEDLDTYIEAFKKAGIEMIHYGQIGKQRFAFFDTEENFGIMLEFQETVKRRKKK